MSLFNNLFKSQPTESAPSTVPVSLAKKVSLRKDMVLNEAKNQGIAVTRARVVFVLDHSGSMDHSYRNGEVQTLLERIFPMAMCFDDNQEMEFYLFDTRFTELPSVTMNNLANYVPDEILKKYNNYGGTEYAPVINAVTNRYGVKCKSDDPTFVIFITDGDNSDRAKAEKAIVGASQFNIFWKFIGIGNASFDFLRHLDDMDGRFVDNANFVPIVDVARISDEVLYQKLLLEYGVWLNKIKSL